MYILANILIKYENSRFIYEQNMKTQDLYMNKDDFEKNI